IGFVVVINQLMNALSRQKIDILSEHSRYLILYHKRNRTAAIQKAMDYRRQGKYVELMQMEDGKGKKDYQTYADAEKFAGVIEMEDI
ncbi:MAG: ATP phosphoribosyltransferase regulatory subunit, partial [Lachnospiraceae bacterium]|nr:ATP phosphoribosyltransferase regulatory subunit [Lachnospiraceae bacterium]